MCGNGGLSKLFGELLTVIQEDLPIKIVVFDNSKLGFVEIKQKVEGMLDTFTRLKNPTHLASPAARSRYSDTNQSHVHPRRHQPAHPARKKPGIDRIAVDQRATRCF